MFLVNKALLRLLRKCLIQASNSSDSMFLLAIYLAFSKIVRRYCGIACRRQSLASFLVFLGASRCRILYHLS